MSVKSTFGWIVAFLSLLLFLGSNSYAQDSVKQAKTLGLTFAAKMGLGYLGGSSSNLMYGYTPARNGLLSGAFYLGLSASERVWDVGLTYRSFGLSQGHSIDALGKENTLSNVFSVIGVYSRSSFPIRAIENLRFVFSLEAGYANLRRLEQLYNPASQEWDKHRKLRHGSAVALGVHLQYDLSKRAYLTLGTDLMSCTFFKRINEYQQKERFGATFVDTSVGLGLNF